MTSAAVSARGNIHLRSCRPAQKAEILIEGQHLCSWTTFFKVLPCVSYVETDVAEFDAKIVEVELPSNAVARRFFGGECEFADVMSKFLGVMETGGWSCIELVF